jgi:hypothetical protein
MKTHWEVEGNIVGIHWEPRKKRFKKFFLPLPPPPQKLKRKKSKAPRVHAWAFPLATRISLPKRVCRQFWPGLLIPLAKNTLPIHIFEGKQIFLHSHFEKINIVSCIYMLDTRSQQKW